MSNSLSNSWKSSSTLTLDIDTANVGDLLVVCLGIPQDDTQENSGSISCANVSTWYEKEQDPSKIEQAGLSIWYGIVDATGPDIITISGENSVPLGIWAGEFTASGTWSFDKGSRTSSSVHATSGHFLSSALSPTNTGELTVGVVTSSSAQSSFTGSTSGYEYDTVSTSGFGMLVAYNLDASTSENPAWSASTLSYVSGALCAFVAS